jgi:hypothetical protein
VILSEASVGSGARRIEAVAAREGWALLPGRSRELAATRAELEEVRREARKPKKAAQSTDVEPDVVDVAGSNVIVMEVPSLDADALLDLSDRFKQRSPPAAVVLGAREDGTVHLVANFDEGVARRISAGDVVKEIAPIVGGGGGGRPTMARAGGKNPEGLADALERARELILGQCTRRHGTLGGLVARGGPRSPDMLHRRSLRLNDDPSADDAPARPGAHMKVLALDYGSGGPVPSPTRPDGPGPSEWPRRSERRPGWSPCSPRSRPRPSGSWSGCR